MKQNLIMIFKMLRTDFFLAAHELKERHYFFDKDEVYCYTGNNIVVNIRNHQIHKLVDGENPNPNGRRDNFYTQERVEVARAQYLDQF